MLVTIGALLKGSCRKGMQCLKEVWGRGTFFQGRRYMDTVKF